MEEFAVTYAPNVFDMRTKVMGRQSAGAGFLRAALNHQPKRVWCYAASRQQAETFGRDVVSLSGLKRPELRYISWDEPHKLSLAGTLYRADPGIGDDAWLRQSRVRARAYSLCGITHTLSSHAAMTVVRDYVTAPLYSWDAVICTSTAVRDLIRQIVEAEQDHLQSRLGAKSFCVPQFPMIPLGTHVADFVNSESERAAARSRLDIGDEDVAFLFVGRLSFHAKAHPLPMFLGLEAAAKKCKRKVHLILCGTYLNKSTEDVFNREAQDFAPSVRLIQVDGADEPSRRCAWASADVFTSLSDNIQETFGLTPIEAMAAGLPVVVSDWNGYKDTVRDGVDGFRIPTTLPAAGAGADLADRFALRLLDYDQYIGTTSLFSAVDADSAAVAYRRLAEAPELRKRMGDAGRRRAHEVYDWAVIFRRYNDLWDELAERRRSDVRVPGENEMVARPDRPDPFALFSHYPTFVLDETSRFRLRTGANATEALRRLKLSTVAYAERHLPSPDLLRDIFGQLTSDDWQSISSLKVNLNLSHPHIMLKTVVWLAKMNMLELERV